MCKTKSGLYASTNEPCLVTPTRANDVDRYNIDEVESLDGYEETTHQGDHTTVVIDLTSYDEVIGETVVNHSDLNSDTLQKLDGIREGLWKIMDEVEMLSQRLEETGNVPLSEASEESQTTARKRNQEVAHLLDGPAFLRRAKWRRRLIQRSM